MAKQLWTIICRKTAIDSQNNLSLLDLVEGVMVAEEPQIPLGVQNVAFPIELVLASTWARTDESKPEKVNAVISLDPPGQPRVKLVDIQIDLIQSPTHRVFLNIPLFPFHGFGKYR